MHDVYPQAVRTLEQVREGYSRGGFRFSDVQDAADAIVEVQQQWADAMNTYPDAQSEIDRLTGRFDVAAARSEEHTSELQSLMRISYAVFCLKKKKYTQQEQYTHKELNNQNEYR